jgi:alpha-tubulin suppressor-like RCC1 family protein
VLTETGYRSPRYSDVTDTINMAHPVVAGGNHTRAHLGDDQVKCWGLNSGGQLGLGDTNARGDGANEMGNNLPAVDLGT